MPNMIVEMVRQDKIGQHHIKTIYHALVRPNEHFIQHSRSGQRGYELPVAGLENKLDAQVHSELKEALAAGIKQGLVLKGKNYYTIPADMLDQLVKYGNIHRWHH